MRLTHIDKVWGLNNQAQHSYVKDDGICPVYQSQSMMLSLCRTQPFMLSPSVTNFAEDMERGWFVLCINPYQWCFHGAEDRQCHLSALRTRLVWEEFCFRYRKARDHQVRRRPMSVDWITPVSGNLYLNCERLISGMVHPWSTVMLWYCFGADVSVVVKAPRYLYVARGPSRLVSSLTANKVAEVCAGREESAEPLYPFLMLYCC